MPTPALGWRFEVENERIMGRRDTNQIPAIGLNRLILFENEPSVNPRSLLILFLFGRI